jgi:Na+-transporting methylmalonyl-CoA/oxaloacetate decarboxylase gamma subunit
MRKKILLIGITFIFIFLLILLFIFSQSKKQSDSQVFDKNRNPDVTGTLNTPSDQEERIDSTQTSNTSQFGLTNVEPKENQTIDISEITNIKFEFNETLDPSQVYVITSPETKITTNVTDKTLIISPEIIWQDGLNIITINAATKSTSGKKLTKDITYRFNVKLPEGL